MIKCAFCKAEATWILGMVNDSIPGTGFGAPYCHKHLIEKAKALEKILNEKSAKKMPYL